MHSAKAPMHSTKSFAECNTRQRGSVEPFHGKACFAECQISGTRQRLCRVSSYHSAKDWRPLAEGSRRLNFLFNFFAECNTRQRIFFFFSKFFAKCHSAEALGKACFSFFLNFLCRVPLPRHSAKHFLLLLFSQLCRVQWSLHSAKPQQYICFLHIYIY